MQTTSSSTAAPTGYSGTPATPGASIGLLGAGIALDSLLSAVAIVLLPLTGVLIRIPFEEARLREGLGASDDEYAARTARLLPGIW